MKTINLRDYYEHIEEDTYMEVTDELLSVFEGYQKAEQKHFRKKYRYKAQYSLDMNDDIENDTLIKMSALTEIYKKNVDEKFLKEILSSLPEIQAKRIYAHYFMGIRKADIARFEGVSKSAVGQSISRGINRMKKIFKKIKKFS